MFRLYDIVSRMGIDEQIAIEVDNEWETMVLVCIKAGGCFRIGEEESNLQRRYEFVRKGYVGDIPIIEDAEYEEILEAQKQLNFKDIS